MTFFNPKEDVIDLELTQYGKFLLSLGQLKPEYYAFFDDDILYDSQYTSETETQNKAKERILTQTPRLKTQYVFRGIETEVKKSNRLTRFGEQMIEDVLQKSDLLKGTRIQQTADKNYALSAPLGTSDIVSDYVPSWKIGFLKGEYQSSNTIITGSYQTARIPQIESELKYRVKIHKEGEVSESMTDFDAPDPTLIFDDGSFIEVTEDFILLNVSEHNTEFGVKNFDVEVFEIQTEKDINLPLGSKEVLVPLYFKKKPELIKNGLLLDNEEILRMEAEAQTFDVDATHAEMFFDILVDNEIPEDIFCSVQPIGEKSDEIYFDVQFNCDEQTEDSVGDLYKSTFKESDYEGCD
jgi:hypothetical protein